MQKNDELDKGEKIYTSLVDEYKRTKYFTKRKYLILQTLNWFEVLS